MSETHEIEPSNAEIGAMTPEERFHRAESLVDSFARWMCRDASVWYNDLVCAGRLALWKFCVSFDPNSKAPFSAMCRTVIRYRIYDECMRMGKFDRALSTLKKRIKKAETELYSQTGVLPDRSDVLRTAFPEEKERKRAMYKLSNRLKATSWDESHNDIGDSANELSERIATEDVHAKVSKCLSTLSGKRRRIVEMRFLEGKGLWEIAREYGVTNSAICESLRVSLKHMRKISGYTSMV